MDVFNKIKNTLSSTVNEITAALPGNPLLREYDTGKQVGSAGPDYLWKIYDGIKKSTKASVSIFILEKRELDHYPRANREQILEIARKGVTQLTKLRHPRVLTVEHAVEESRDSLVFCTEPVFASLGNILGKRSNISQIPEDLLSHELYDVEIKYGVLQISEGLSFLHGAAKMLHGNLSPESIIVNKQGVWKLSGFDFCVLNNNPSGEPKFSCLDWDTTLPGPAQPNPNFLAPEIITEKRRDFSSDMFSLGALLYSIYYSGRSLLTCYTKDIYKIMPTSANKLRNLSAHDLSKVPPEVLQHEQMLIHPDATVRPDADQVSKLPYFEDIGVATLQYLDNILQRDNLQKSQFFKSLSQVLSKLPKRVVIQRILPSLTAEFHNTDMIPFVLPNVLKITEDCSDQQYRTLVFPALVPVFKVQTPVQVLLILLRNMDLLLKKTQKNQVQAHLLPMICNALGAPSLQTQELSLSIIPTFAEQLDFPSMKNSVVPRIKKLILEGGSLSVRINALVCIGKILPMFDKWFIYDEIYPTLHQIKSREPGILMGILGIYQITFNHQKLGINKDILASKVIPHLLPLSVENNLNLQQFNNFMAVIKEMIQKVESEQRSKLEQLSQMRVDESSENFKKLSMKEKENATNDRSAGNKTNDIFGGIQSKSANNSGDIKATRQHLTLEEKQRLAKEKEQEYRMKQQGQIKPMKTYQVNSSLDQQKPKDLTSTLMQNNLSMMTKSTSATMSNGTNTGTYRMTQSSSMPVQGNRFPSGPNYNPGTMQSSMPSYGGMTQPRMPTATSAQGWSATPNYSVPPQGIGQQKSSLDSLLNMPSQNKGPPMRNLTPVNHSQQSYGYGVPRPMGRTQQNVLQPNQGSPNAFDMSNPFMTPSQPSSQPPATTGNLSKQDLLDFLG